MCRSERVINMAAPRIFFAFLIAVTASTAAAAAAADSDAAKRLRADSPKLAANATAQLLAAFARLRSDYDASEARELKAQTSAEVRAALSQGSAALAEVRVQQRQQLHDFAQEVGNKTAELTSRYLAVIKSYLNGKPLNAKPLRQVLTAKQTALAEWEGGLYTLLGSMRDALRSAYTAVASSTAGQKAVDAVVVRLVDDLIQYQHGVVAVLTVAVFSEVEAFVASAGAEILRLANHVA